MFAELQAVSFNTIDPRYTLPIQVLQTVHIIIVLIIIEMKWNEGEKKYSFLCENQTNYC